MEIRRVCVLYFSATGNTEKTAGIIGEALAEHWDVPLVRIPFVTPVERAKEHSFTETDFAVIGAPTYAGKLPNKILPDFRRALHGSRTPAAAVVTFGNRSYDNALAELCAVLKENGFRVTAGGAFVGRHAFTDALAEGRPDENDVQEMLSFAAAIADKVKNLPEEFGQFSVPGDASAPYYVPRGIDGQPARFLKAVPQTNPERCTRCGLCARVCPMGAIDPEDVFRVTGTCIKCHACVGRCAAQAKYFDDPAFLSHAAMLEQNFTEPKRNEVFL